jgi:hypothetical protein
VKEKISENKKPTEKVSDVNDGTSDADESVQEEDDESVLPDIDIFDPSWKEEDMESPPLGSKKGALIKFKM